MWPNYDYANIGSYIEARFAFLVFILLSGSGGVVFEPVAPTGDGDGLSVVQKTIQDRALETSFAKPSCFTAEQPKASLMPSKPRRNAPTSHGSTRTACNDTLVLIE